MCVCAQVFGCAHVEKERSLELLLLSSFVHVCGYKHRLPTYLGMGVGGWRRPL